MRVLGMMSGTSIDGIDLAVASFHHNQTQLEMRLEWHGEFFWPTALRNRLLEAVSQTPVTVAQWCRLDTETGQVFGEAAAWAIESAGPVDLIACHGQTLFHWVEDAKAQGTLQIGNPAWIQGRTNTPVIHNFRAADIVAGGQGAPLVSTLDAMWLQGCASAALNIGGIANATFVLDNQVVAGDIGPGNCLLDSAAQHEVGKFSDVDGRLAAQGRIHEEVLEALLSDPYFLIPLPKSTGREYFHSNYVRDRSGSDGLHGPDLFATLTEFTARTIANAIKGHDVQRVIASGGGLKNPTLMDRIKGHLDIPVYSADELGLPSEAKEAYAFALLGFLAHAGYPGVWQNSDGQCLTGAATPRVLGSSTPPTSLARPASLPKLTLHPTEKI